MKIAKVKLSKQFLEMIIRADISTDEKISTDAPRDLEILGFLDRGEDYPYTFTAIVRSDTFGDILEGGVIPVIKPFTYTVDLK
jgi:hypothetical protein